MRYINSAAFSKMEKRFRTTLINSLSGFKSVNLVGSISEQGVTNLSIVSSVVHLGANPALMGFVMRPVTVTRDTYNNIRQTGFYTFNHITTDIYKQAHQTSARYPAETSEFEAVELNAVFKENFPAPFVEKSPIQIGLEFKEQIDIKINGTILMIGEVKTIFVPEDCLAEDGFLSIEKAGSLTCSSLDSYHTTTQVGRLSYAKPGENIREL